MCYLYDFSTFGIVGTKWGFAARATCTTMCCSFGGGVIGLAGCYILFGGKINVPFILNCVLGSLAAIAGSSYLVKMWEALCIGLFSGLLTFMTLLILERSNLDDPCGVFAAHGINGIWGLLALGIFGKKNHEIMDNAGLLYGGSIEITLYDYNL